MAVISRFAVRRCAVALALVCLMAEMAPVDATCPAEHKRDKCCERFLWNDCSADVFNDCCALSGQGNCKSGYSKTIDHDSTTCNGLLEAVCCTPEVTTRGPACDSDQQVDKLRCEASRTCRVTFCARTESCGRNHRWYHRRRHRARNRGPQHLGLRSVLQG